MTIIVDIFDDYSFIQLHITSCFIKSDILKDYKFNTNIKYGEDLLFSCKSILNSNSIMLLSKPLYNYVYNVQGASKIVNLKTCIKRLEDEIYVNTEVCKMYLEYIDLEEIAIKRVNNCFMYNLKSLAYKDSYKNYKQYISSVLEMDTKYIYKESVIKQKNFLKYLVYKFGLTIKNIIRGR